MSILDLPRRIMLDAEAIDFVLDFGEYISDGVPAPGYLDDLVTSEIDALYRFFIAGEKASWRFAVVSYVYREVMRTQDPTRRYFIANWLDHLRKDWLAVLGRNCYVPTHVEAENIRAELFSSDLLVGLVDRDIRILIAEAVVNRCDLICSRDYKRLLKIRDRVRDLPVRIVSPLELWELVSAYAHLWED